MVELVSVILSFIYRHALSQAVKEGIFLSMEKYGMNSDVSHAVDLLQSQVIKSCSSQPEILQETNFDGAFNKIIILSKKLFSSTIKTQQMRI